jgi:hypothetical protein
MMFAGLMSMWTETFNAAKIHAATAYTAPVNVLSKPDLIRELDLWGWWHAALIFM